MRSSSPGSSSGWQQTQACHCSPTSPDHGVLHRCQRVSTHYGSGRRRAEAGEGLRPPACRCATPCLPRHMRRKGATCPSAVLTIAGRSNEKAPNRSRSMVATVVKPVAFESPRDDVRHAPAPRRGGPGRPAPQHPPRPRPRSEPPPNCPLPGQVPAPPLSTLHSRGPACRFAAPTMISGSGVYPSTGIWRRRLQGLRSADGRIPKAGPSTTWSSTLPLPFRQMLRPSLGGSVNLRAPAGSPRQLKVSHQAIGQSR